GGERIAVIAQRVEQVARYRLTCRSDIDLKNPGSVLAENLVLRLGRQLRVTVLGSELFRYREGLESLDLPIRRSDHGCVGTPQNVIGTKAVEQVPDEDRVPRRIRPHHPGQAAELGIDIFYLGHLGLTGELGFPRKGAVEGDKVEVGKSGGRS